MSEIFGTLDNIENEYTHKIDKNALSLYDDLIKQKRDSLITDSQSFSPVQESFVYKLSNDEKYILSCFSLLGDIRVDAVVFKEWTEEKFSETISILIKKGLIKSSTFTDSGELSISKEISEVVRTALKPDLSNCICVKKLCENIASYMEEQSKKLKRIKPRKSILPDDLICVRNSQLLNLLLEVLWNLRYSNPKEISLCIKYLTKSYQHDVDRFSSRYGRINLILEKCFSSPSFAKTTSDVKINAYTTYICSQLHTLWNCRPDSLHQIEKVVEQIHSSLSLVNKVLNKTPQLTGQKHIYTAYLPIIEAVCYEGPICIKINTKEDPAYMLVEDVTNYMEGVIASGNITEEDSKKYTYFKLLVEEIIELEEAEKKGFNAYLSILCRDDSYDEAIARIINENNINEEKESEILNTVEERNDVYEQYCEKIDITKTHNDLEIVLKEIINDECLNLSWKISLLYGRVKKLGFDPFLNQIVKSMKRGEIDEFDEDSPFSEMILSTRNGKSRKGYYEDTVQNCTIKENQATAKILINHLMPLLEQEDPSDSTATQFSFQALMVALFTNDKELMKKYTNDYYSKVIINPSLKRYEIMDHFSTLHLMNESRFALEFIQRGIEFIDIEVQKQEAHENTLYELYEILVTLTECTNDTFNVDYYKEMQNNVLGLGFTYKDNDAYWL